MAKSSLEKGMEFPIVRWLFSFHQTEYPDNYVDRESFLSQLRLNCLCSSSY